MNTIFIIRLETALYLLHLELAQFFDAIQTTPVGRIEKMCRAVKSLTRLCGQQKPILPEVAESGDDFHMAQGSVILRNNFNFAIQVGLKTVQFKVN